MYNFSFQVEQVERFSFYLKYTSCFKGKNEKVQNASITASNNLQTNKQKYFYPDRAAYNQIQKQNTIFSVDRHSIKDNVGWSVGSMFPCEDNLSKHTK